MVQDPKLQVLGQWYVLPRPFRGLVLYFMGFLTNRLKKHSVQIDLTSDK